MSSNSQNAPGAFSHKGFVFRALPHQRTPRIPRAPKARAKKNWQFCGKYCPKFTLKCCSLRFPPATRSSPLYRLNYKAQKRPPLTVFNFSNREFARTRKTSCKREAKSFLAGMCPQILKMHQERFLTKGSFFARSPTNELQGFRERRRRERRKIGDFFCGKYCPKFTLKCCSLRFPPATRSSPYYTALITKLKNVLP